MIDSLSLRFEIVRADQYTGLFSIFRSDEMQVKHCFEFFWALVLWPHFVRFKPGTPHVLRRMGWTIVSLVSDVVFLTTILMLWTEYVDIGWKVGFAMAMAIVAHLYATTRFNRIEKKGFDK